MVQKIGHTNFIVSTSMHRHRKLFWIRGALVLYKAQCFLGGGAYSPEKFYLYALRQILMESGANVSLKMSVLSSLSCGMEKYLR